MVSIAEETPDQEEIRVLLCQSDAFSAALYPPESCHLVDVAALAAPQVRFFVARHERRAVGCGAVVLGNNGTAEIKRMFVDAASRGHGVGRAILSVIEGFARHEGAVLLLLETRTRNREAIELYRGRGYCERGPFGNYRPDTFSVFMEKRIQPTWTSARVAVKRSSAA